MIHMTSRRERRLWLWAGAVVVAIYATLPAAGVLADALRDRGLVDGLFFAMFCTVLLAIGASAVSRRLGRREVWVAVGVTAVYATVALRMFVSSEERTHLFEYGLVAALIYAALVERRTNGGHVRAPAVFAFLFTVVFGWLDELIQLLLPTRVYDIRDVGFNALAAFMAVFASYLLGLARDRDKRTAASASIQSK